MNRSGKLALPAAGLGLMLAGCHWGSARRPSPPTIPASNPSDQARPAAADSQPGSSTWTDPHKSVRLKWPAGWQVRPNADYDLMLIPAGSTKSEPFITLDVPDLPPHLPWMLQMNRIEHDYLANLKKAHADLNLQDATDLTLPNSTARLVRTNWKQSGATHDDVVLLLIHASAVYILDARSEESQMPKTRAAFNSVQASLQWTK